MDHSRGLPPVVGDDARVLILGSLPSVRSIELQQYYAFHTNAFWKIMGQLFGAKQDLPYETRVDQMRQQGIALWDTLASAVREGSLDARIDPSTAKANDIHAFLKAHSGIRLIAFNGQTSQKYFDRFVVRDSDVALPQLDYLLMPSTSAANRSMTDRQKLDRWSAIKEFLSA